MITAQQILESISQAFRLDERNMYDTEAVDYWIDKKFYVLDDEIQKWLNTRLRKYIINDFSGVKKVDHTYTSPIYRLPDWVEQAIKRGEEVVYFDAGTREVHELEDEIHHVMDYFEYLLAHPNDIDPRLRLHDLTRVSVEDAIEKSKQWTRWLSKRDAGADDPGGYEEVFRVGNYRWVQLLSGSQLDYEGKEMGHCVGSYASKVAAKHCDIFSLRDLADEPHITMEVVNHTVKQIKGKQNKAPIEKYWDAAVKFLQFGAKKGWFKKFSELENVGAVEHRGEVYSEGDAPEDYQLTKGLTNAVKSRDKNKILELLERGADVNAVVSDRDETILMVAASWYSNTKIIDILLDGGADLEAEDDSGNTAIFYANDADVAEKLRRAGANLHHKNKRGNTAFTSLGSSTYSSPVDEDLLKFFLGHGFDVDEKDSSGNTVLYNIMSRNNLKTASLLVKYGANVDFVGNNGETLLQKNCSLVMSSEGAPPVLEFLITHGADPNTPIEYDGTILISRLTRGDHFSAHLLLDRGADPNATDQYNRTPLYHAITKCGQGIGMGGEQTVAEITEHLLRKGADPDVYSERTNSGTPLYAACDRSYVKVVQILLENGADPNLGSDRQLPLRAASNNDKPHAEKMVRLLLDHGADPTIEDHQSLSVLDYAERYGGGVLADMVRAATENH